MLGIIQCGTLTAEPKLYFNEHNELYMIKFAVTQMRRDVDKRNGRINDSWNITVREKQLIEECDKLTVGSKVFLSGRVESNAVANKTTGGMNYFTEFITTEIVPLCELKGGSK